MFQIHSSDENYQPHGEPLATASTYAQAKELAAEHAAGRMYGAVIVTPNDAVICGDETAEELSAILAECNGDAQAELVDRLSDAVVSRLQVLASLGTSGRKFDTREDAFYRLGRVHGAIDALEIVVNSRETPAWIAELSMQATDAYRQALANIALNAKGGAA